MYSAEMVARRPAACAVGVREELCGELNADATHAECDGPCRTDALLDGVPGTRVDPAGEVEAGSRFDEKGESY